MPTPITRTALGALCGLPLVVSQAAAADAASAGQHADAASLMPIAVTAQRAPQVLADTIPQTTVFDAQDIEIGRAHV